MMSHQKVVRFYQAILTTQNHDEYYLGSWEANPLDTFTSLQIQGINVSNVKIIGEGILDGNANSDWWKYPKNKRGAWRPRLFQTNKL